SGGGNVTVTVTTSGGTSSGVNYDYTTATSPTLSSISPTSGPASGGTTVTLTGTNFVTTSGGTTVDFGTGNPATGVSCSSTSSCTAVSPSGTGTVSVTVTTSGGTSGAQSYTYIPAPTLTSISPTSGPQAGGTSFSITGTNFSTASGGTTVDFGTGNPATSVSCSTTSSCSGTTPVGPSGGGNVTVTVTTSGGTSSGVNYDYTTATSPTLSSISPTSGPAAGGTTVTLTGTNFVTTSGGTTVDFGTNAATSVTCSTTSSCTAVSPSGTGTVSVTVTTSGGTSGAQSYTYIPAPTLTGISPTSGPVTGGTTVTLTGTNFSTASSGTTVDFGSGNAATSVTCSTTSSCTAVSPSGTGTVSVTVTTAGGTSSGQSYTYIPAPTLSSITPTSGPQAGGTSFSITGTNFSTASGGTTVDFGTGNPATSVSCSTTSSCSGTTPVGPSGGGNVNVTVTTSGGTSSGVNYDYTSATSPTLSSISPTSGPEVGATSFSITGTKFSTASGGTTVDFGTGNPATSVSCSTTSSCSGTTPAGPSGGGNVNVTVTTSGGTSGAVTYTYIAPTLTSISPTSGPAAGGNTVTLTGTNFVTTSGGTTVDFGTNAATGVSCTSTTSCSATVPSAPSGTVNKTVSVTVTTSDGTSNGVSYTYIAPSLTSVTPNAGAVGGGTTVTLSGSNFVTTSGGTSVSFGSNAATGVSCSSTTSCTATSPAGPSGGGPVNVTVTTSDGTSNNISYTYLLTPTLTSISPNDGPVAGGTSVTITGTNFSTATGGTTVDFGAGNPAPKVACLSSTSCFVEIPKGPAGGGVVSVTVTTGGGTSSPGVSFTYMPVPTITSITPTSGSQSGGTTVTVTGTGFSTVSGVVEVEFGTTYSGSVTCSSTTSCTAVSPASYSAGPVSVTVTTVGGTSSPGVSFDYIATIPTPTLTSISPTSGPASGGTTVTLTGTNFDTSSGGTTVDFGSGNAATPVDCPSATSCSAVTPAGTGTVSVTVTTTGGTSSSVSYTYIAAPTLTSISPNYGSQTGGTTVELVGTNFDTTPGGTTVDFGSVASTTVICTATTLCTATSPSGPSGGGPVNVTVTTGAGTSNAVSFTYQLGATVSSAYVPLSSPSRICDTRPVSVLKLDYPNGYGWDSQCAAKTLGVGATLTITAAGYVGDGGSSDVVPTNATAVVVNVTVADHTTGGYITVYPAGASMPTTSSLNFTPPTSTSGPLANLLQVTLGTGSSAGEISIYNHWGSTDVAVDVMGYFIPVTSSGQGSFVPLSSPSRICDTRSTSVLSKLYPNGYGWDTQCATKTLTGHTASDTLTISASGYVGNAGSSDVVPTGASAVVLNVTEASNTLGGYLTVFPASSTMAKTSNLNFMPVSGAVPNGVIVGLSSSGKLSIFDLKGSVNVTVDVIGYYISTTSSDEYHGLDSPTRICDTRSTSLLPTLYPSGYGWDTQCATKTLSPNSTLTISAVGYVGDGGSNEVVPQGATAVVLNVTEATHTTGGYLTVYPAGTTRPTTSNLNFISTSGAVPNFVTVGLPTTGSNAGNISIYNLWGDTNITVDVVGYYG
ncbi:MAG: IPT/TIG domain-containing protein, partial [Actinobacteria bacterium]|nr:IPT/TIG domain-containing protein [Actinomycetota bacterium]